jgi:deoxyhypusine synthase
MQRKKQRSKPEENVLKPSIDLEGWPEVKGYDFEKKFSIKDFINAFYNTGFQATSLYKAIQLFKKMLEEDATIFLGFTSNMASCGVRDIITYLIKHKMVDVLSTTAGGVEEDIIKCHKPFVLGDYDAPGEYLRRHGINRTGNLFIPNDRYIWFERYMNSLLDRLYKKQKKDGKPINSVDFCKEMGYELGRLGKKDKDLKYKDSLVYQAYKNNIPLFGLPLTDGSIGDMIYFFKKRHKDFQLDIADDIEMLTDIALNAEKTGIIAIGGSVPKHQICNANLFRGGADYTIYINLGIEYEGSNAGANPDEAVSWGKLVKKDNTVKVFGEASIVFPLLVLGVIEG